MAVAVIEDGQGRVLLSRRHDHVHQGGLWEFPGGKREPGESLAAALRREIQEELGIQVKSHRPLIQVTHDYGDRQVLLDVQRVLHWQGQVQGREGQALAWVGLNELHQYPLPAADRPIVSALRLPDRYLIASPDCNDAEAFRLRLAAALAAGVRLVQFRPPPGGEGLLDLAISLCQAHGAQLLINSRMLLAKPGLGLDLDRDRGLDLGLHLTSSDLMRLRHRPDVAGWLAASCHSPEELARAAELELDFALLSPVQATASHPAARPLGWQRFRDWVGDAALPVYALGGMGLDQLEQAWACGAQGIAGIRGLW